MRVIEMVCRREWIAIANGLQSNMIVIANGLSSRAKRGIWVFAGSGGTGGAGKNQDPSRCSG
jgi:hypothetical protein